MTRRRQSRAARWLALGLALLAMAVTAYGLLRHNNWYLASDQAAFLTIARDMRAGTVFHDTAIFDETVPLRFDWKRYDALQQTYFLEGDRLYSRYPPGFPALLALAGAIAGEQGEHWLNPLLYLATLVVLARLVYRLLRPHDRALAAGAAVLVLWLVLLVPSGVHLWGITVARDLPAHLFGLLSLVFTVRSRPVSAGLSLGVAMLIRPDALLYAVPAAAVAWLDRLPVRYVLLWGGALALGASPLLGYNWITQGNPFSFTQGGEFREILGWLLPTSAHAAAGNAAIASGGGFRLANLAATLPGNLELVGRSFGVFLLFAVAAIAWSMARQRLVAATLLPYPVVAILFYSCWVHPDARYLAGASLCLLALVAIGGVVTLRALVDARTGPGWRVFAVVVAAGALGVQGAVLQGAAPAGLAPGWPLVILLVSGSLFASGHRWYANPKAVVSVVPAVALAVLALLQLVGGSRSWGPVREPQIRAAQEFVAQHVPPGSLLLASPSLGRPAENWRVYSGVEAFYPAEFSLFDYTPERAIPLALAHGRRVFRLVDARRRIPRDAMPGVATVVAVARIPQERALDVYADPRRAPAGVVLYEFVSSPAERERLRRFLDLDGVRSPRS